MKVLSVIKKVIIGILALTFFSFVIAMTVLMLNINDYGVTQFSDKTWVIMREETANPNYNKGDLVILENKKLNTIKVGEEIFVYKVNKVGPASIEIGVIGEIYPEEDVFSFENGAAYSGKFIAGKVDKVYPEYGKYLGVVQSQWGFLFIVLVPSFLIFVYELYALVVEIKYGKEEHAN